MGEASYAGCVMTLEERVIELCRQHGGLRRAARAIKMDASYMICIRDGKKRPSKNALRKLGMVEVLYYRRIALQESDDG